MAGALLGVCGVFVILMTDEILWRLKVLRGEASRKLVHLLVGTFIAFWPFIMTMTAIQILAVAMLVVVALSRQYHIFQGIHAIKRLTYGEYFFAISVGLTAYITDSKWIFVAAILHLSLADGLAALVGKRFGKKNHYKILTQYKSLAGTATFCLVSFVITAVCVLIDIELYTRANVWIIACLPLFATLAESVGVYGTDDLVVPLLVVGVLETIKTTV